MVSSLYLCWNTVFRIQFFFCEEFEEELSVVICIFYLEFPRDIFLAIFSSYPCIEIENNNILSSIHLLRGGAYRKRIYFYPSLSFGEMSLRHFKDCSAFFFAIG